jgi:hypothetical protein
MIGAGLKAALPLEMISVRAALTLWRANILEARQQKSFERFSIGSMRTLRGRSGFLSPDIRAPKRRPFPGYAAQPKSI